MTSPEKYSDPEEAGPTSIAARWMPWKTLCWMMISCPRLVSAVVGSWMEIASKLLVKWLPSILMFDRLYMPRTLPPTPVKSLLMIVPDEAPFMRIAEPSKPFDCWLLNWALPIAQLPLALVASIRLPLKMKPWPAALPPIVQSLLPEKSNAPCVFAPGAFAMTTWPSAQTVTPDLPTIVAPPKSYVAPPVNTRLFPACTEFNLVWIVA